MYPVQYNRWQYALCCLQTTNAERKKPLALSASLHYVQCSSACSCIGGEPIHGQWSPLYSYAHFFYFGDSNNIHLADFPTSASTVYSHVCFHFNVKVEYYIQQPAFLFGHGGLVYGSYLQQWRTTFSIRHRQGTVVFTLAK